MVVVVVGCGGGRGGVVEGEPERRGTKVSSSSEADISLALIRRQL